MNSLDELSRHKLEAVCLDWWLNSQINISNQHLQWNFLIPSHSYLLSTFQPFDGKAIQRQVTGSSLPGIEKQERRIIYDSFAPMLHSGKHRRRN